MICQRTDTHAIPQSETASIAGKRLHLEVKAQESKPVQDVFIRKKEDSYDTQESKMAHAPAIVYTWWRIKRLYRMWRKIDRAYFKHPERFTLDGYVWRWRVITKKIIWYQKHPLFNPISASKERTP